jgi:integrase
LYETLSESEISLLERAKDNDLLNLGEIEALVARCKYKKSILKNSTALGSPNVVPIRRALTKTRISRLNLHAVKADTAAMRLHYIASYLQWFVEYIFLLNIPSNRQEFREIGALTIRAIKNRTPNSSTSKARRKGLTKEQEHKLLRLIELDSPQNPWANQFIRNRNNLIVRLLLATGIRKGELLGLKIHDIEDFRIRQPQSKTASRRLQIAQDLADGLREHIEEYRIKQGDARKYPFVFVSDQGIPLALNSIDLIFSMLRRAAPELAPISAHILRHTWNDRFSELVEGASLNLNEEKQLRNYLMGWSEKSKMAEKYTVRYIEERARAMSLKMQNSTYKGAE